MIRVFTILPVDLVMRLALANGRFVRRRGLAIAGFTVVAEKSWTAALVLWWSLWLWLWCVHGVRCWGWRKIVGANDEIVCVVDGERE